MLERDNNKLRWNPSNMKLKENQQIAEASTTKEILEIVEQVTASPDLKKEELCNVVKKNRFFFFGST